jgi:hypothetical protein
MILLDGYVPVNILLLEGERREEIMHGHQVMVSWTQSRPHDRTEPAPDPAHPLRRSVLGPSTRLRKRRPLLRPRPLSRGRDATPTPLLLFPFALMAALSLSPLVSLSE